MRSYWDGMRRYFELSGRSTRRQYWLFWIMASVLCIGAVFVDDAVLGHPITDRYPGPLTASLAVIHFLPGIAVTVRRLHDVGRSGWWYFIQCVPLIGTLIMLFWMLAPPNEWDNEFGPNPRNLSFAPGAAPATRSTIPRQVRMGSGPHPQLKTSPNGDVERFI